MIRLVPPCSKSDAIRALILADITGSRLHLPEGELASDIEVVRRGLAALRAGGEVEIDCGDGAAPFRFLLTQAALWPTRTVRFVGSPRLGLRPHQPLISALAALPGVTIAPGSPWPLVVRTRGWPEPRRLEASGVQSSQFLSSLLLGAAKVVAERRRPCAVLRPREMASAGYLDLTLRWLTHAGFEVREGAELEVLGVRPVKQLPELPGDWSSLCFLLVLAWASGAGVAGVQRNSGHPDEAVVDHLRSVGLQLTSESRIFGSPRGGLEVDSAACPDAVPALVALAATLPQASRFFRTEILRQKESDRVEGLLDLCARGGARAQLEGTCLHVSAGSPHDFAFDARGDHRLAMAAATFAFLADVRLDLRGRETVAKSFPAFWSELAKVSGLRRLIDNGPP